MMLLNKANTRKYILKQMAARRPGLAERLTRVSGATFEALNARLMVMIQKEIDAHPTVGQTFVVKL